MTLPPEAAMDPGRKEAGAVSEITIPAGAVELQCELTLPEAPVGIVLFAHGSGSSRHSPRNRFVASVLQDGSLATVLMDLLTPAEDEIDSRTAELRFNIELLSERMIGAVDWVRQQTATQGLNVGLFWSQHGSGGCSGSGGAAAGGG